MNHSSIQRRVHAIEEKQAGPTVPDASAPKLAHTQRRVPEAENERTQLYLTRQIQTFPCTTARARA